jgi:DNA-damage-inducible protein J
VATVNFSIRLDEEVKKQLDEFCDKVGISTNAAFSMFAHRVAMDKCLPFAVTSTDAQSQHHQWVLERLKEREQMANDPNTEWLTVDEVMGKFRDKYGI